MNFNVSISKDMKFFPASSLMMTHPLRTVLSCFFPGLLTLALFILSIPAFVFIILSLFELNSLEDFGRQLLSLIIDGLFFYFCGLYTLSLIQEVRDLILLKVRGLPEKGLIVGKRTYRSGGSNASPIYRIEYKIKVKNFIHTASTVKGILQRSLEGEFQEGESINLLIDPENSDRMRAVYRKQETSPILNP